MPRRPSTAFLLRLADDDHEALRAVAEATDRSMNQVARQYIREGIAKTQKKARALVRKSKAAGQGKLA